MRKFIVYLTKNKFVSKTIILDFEMAVHTAITTVFLTVNLRCCRFLLRKAQFRKILALGLKEEYVSTQSDIGKLAQNVILTYLLPFSEVGDAFARPRRDHEKL